MTRLALICLALAACVDQQPPTSSTVEAATAGVYPHQWNTRMVGTAYFWPTNANSVQMLITDGDRQNGQDTFYAWIINDGTSVFTVYRVNKTDMMPFQGAARQAFAMAESYAPQKFDSITGSVGHAPPIPPPVIGPGGDGDITTAAGYFPQSFVIDAITAGESIKSATAGFFAPDVVRSGGLSL